MNAAPNTAISDPIVRARRRHEAYISSSDASRHDDERRARGKLANQYRRRTPSIDAFSLKLPLGANKNCLKVAAFLMFSPDNLGIVRLPHEH